MRFFNATTGLLLLRMGRGVHSQVLTSLDSLSSLQHRAVVVSCLKLSGSMRALLPQSRAEMDARCEHLMTVLPAKVRAGQLSKCAAVCFSFQA